MNVLVVIPARYASTRFPAKPLVDLKGKSMIQRVYEQIQKCKAITKILVATDDERIENHCKEKNISVQMTAQYHQNGTSRCAEIVEKLQTQKQEFDWIVNVQGDEPLFRPEQLDQLLQVLASPQTTAPIATMVRRLTQQEDIENPNIVKAVLNKKQEALYFSRSPIPFLREKKNQSTATYWQHVGVYAFRPETLLKLVQLAPSPLEESEQLEQLRWLEHDFSIQSCETPFATHAIDTPDDVTKILTLL